jgi:hypothetical protein
MRRLGRSDTIARHQSRGEPIGARNLSPGPLSSNTRGGFNFTHGRQFHSVPSHRSAPFYGNRALPGQRQRFTVTPQNGGSRLVLDDGEQVTIGQADDGSVTIDITPKPENGNGNNGALPVEASSRRFPVARDRSFRASGRHYAAPQSKVDITTHPEGSLTLAPTQPTNSLLVVENPDGAFDVAEIEPPEPAMPMAPPAP